VGLYISIERRGADTVVVLSGDLDVGAAAWLRRSVQRAAETTEGRLVVDLRDAASADADTLVAIANESPLGRERFVIRAADGALRALLEDGGAAARVTFEPAAGER
jgi:anti-anti-sigma regulatory factor